MSELIDAFGLVLTPALPIMMMMAWCVPTWRCRIACWLPWAALPPLMLALAGSDMVLPLSGFLFGNVLRMDDTTRVFLGFSALLWLAAGLYARDALRYDPNANRFRLLWLACQSGNYGLILSADVASFYAAFALMTFAAYGLVIHKRTPEALRAGRIYLVMAVLGEAMIIAGLLLAASQLASPVAPLLSELPAAIAAAERRDLIIALLIGGFGVKAGLPLLHMWLPLAHPAAPVAASAVLSGTMIKAGLLGWLHTLPLGLITLPQWSTLLIGAGLLAAIGAALIGVNQNAPKTVLAYSSVSQMGLITVGMGVGIGAPEAWPLMLPAITLYALHHGLAKGALFLGTGLAGPLARPLAQRLFMLGMALPALSLTGVMVSGGSAKLALKEALASSQSAASWWHTLPLWLSLAAVGTTLLIARWWYLLSAHQTERHAGRGAWLGWLLLVTSGSLVVLALPWARDALPTGDKLPSLLWPVIVGAIIALFFAPRGKPLSIPAGDLIAPIEVLSRGVSRRWRMASLAVKRQRRVRNRTQQGAGDASRHGVHMEQRLRRNAGLMFALLLALMLLIMLV